MKRGIAPMPYFLGRVTPRPLQSGQGAGRPRDSARASFPEPLHRWQIRPGGRGRR
jgi:hypothetical protein